MTDSPTHTPRTADTSANPGAARFHALIPCAGAGSRAGTAAPKQYEHVAGHAVVWHTLHAFRGTPEVSGIAVVVAPQDGQFASACPDFGRAGERLLACGGSTRAESVRNGLVALLESAASPDDWVLVHDAARCLIQPAQISALIAACRNDPVGGLLAHKLADTLKREEDGRVAETVPRNDKWLAQTPQMFRAGELLNALNGALNAALAGNEAPTDEAAAMQAQGHRPLLVAGSAQNFKVTYPEDFAMAHAVLEARKTGKHS